MTPKPKPPQQRTVEALTTTGGSGGTTGAPILLHGVQIHPRVRDIAREHGYSLETIVDTFIEPEASWRGQDDNSVVHLRGEIAVIEAARSGEVVAMASRRRALELRQQPRQGAIRRITGGIGRRFPTSTADLLLLLRSFGFTIKRAEGHYVVTHPGCPERSLPVPKTPSDHRSIPNTVLDIRRGFGIDLRQDLDHTNDDAWGQDDNVEPPHAAVGDG